MNPNLSAKDFANNNEVRWCPGCGDYAILKALQNALPKIGLAPEKHVFISGIGCAGRLPYYMNAYGLHTIHGRASAVATGLSLMRDDLCIWVITGDGDALSIGGNHLIHCLRRNVNIKILLINNQVYGLTKGQFSPTSPVGQVSKTSPEGVNNKPLNPILLALASGGSFVARSIDKDINHLSYVIQEAYAHKGCSLIEIYQDCNIYNSGAFDEFTLKANRAENTLLLEDQKPYLFGKDLQSALYFTDDKIEVTKNSQKYSQHNIGDIDMAMRLSRLSYPQYPVPLGVFYKEERDIFSAAGKIKKTKEDLKEDLKALFRERASWVIS